MSNNLSSRVQSNLLQQNCFVRDVRRAVDLKDGEQPSSYVSLDEKIVDDGFKQEFNSYDYPITPSYVDSFIDSSDYRRDPANAIIHGHDKKNMGDVTQLQNILHMDTASQRELYAQLQKKFNAPAKIVSDTKIVSGTKTVSGTDANSNGGNDNVKK